MERRYSGDVEIFVLYDPRGFYKTAVRRGGRVLWRGSVRPSRGAPTWADITGTSPAAIDAAAGAALAHSEDAIPNIGAITEETEDGRYKVHRTPPRAATRQATSRLRSRRDEGGPYAIEQFSPAYGWSRIGGTYDSRADASRAARWVFGFEPSTRRFKAEQLGWRIVPASASAARDRARRGRDDGTTSRRNADLIAWYQRHGERNMPRGFRAEKIQWMRRTNRSNALDAVRRMGYRG